MCTQGDEGEHVSKKGTWAWTANLADIEKLDMTPIGSPAVFALGDFPWQACCAARLRHMCPWSLRRATMNKQGPVMSSAAAGAARAAEMKLAELGALRCQHMPAVSSPGKSTRLGLVRG